MSKDELEAYAIADRVIQCFEQGAGDRVSRITLASEIIRKELGEKGPKPWHSYQYHPGDYA